MRQLQDSGFQWAELQEMLWGEETDAHDRIRLDDRNKRSDKRQVRTVLVSDVLD